MQTLIRKKLFSFLLNQGCCGTSLSLSLSLSLHPTQRLDTMGACSNVHVSLPFVCLSLCLFYRFADKVNTLAGEKQAAACCFGVICCVCTDLAGEKKLSLLKGSKEDKVVFHANKLNTFQLSAGTQA